MKKYIQTLPAVMALQWTENVKHPAVKFGKSSTTDRFNDTPDGWYVDVPGQYGAPKRILRRHDWLIFDNKGEKVIKVVDNTTFEKEYSVEIPADIKSDMDFVRRLESDMGFMGSPSYDEAKKRIERWNKQQ